MFSAIREYFVPPVFADDEQKTSTARILFLAFKFYYLLSILVLIGDIFIFVRKLQILLIVLLFLIILSIARYLAFRGKILHAGYLIVAFLWCVYTPAIWFSGGVTSLLAVSYIIISILAGLLLGRRTSIIIAVISCFTLLFMYLSGSYGINPSKYFPVPPGSILFLWFSSFLIIVPMINLALQILREALSLKRKEVAERKKAEVALRENEVQLIAAKEEAEDLSRLKTTILNNMSHELRTPLIGIMGFAEALESEIKDPFLKNMVTQISTSSKRLSDTLNLLLDLSKMESEKLNAVYKNINLSEVTRYRVVNYEGSAKAKELTLKTMIKEENIAATTDERMFSQILDNLLNNAIKFTNSGGILVVLDKAVSRVDNVQKQIVKLKVTDTGIGIAPENYKLIFEEYRQVSSGLSRSFQGTGLGLTITKRFVEILGGEITVESKLGVGSTFTVTLPISR